jgi:hypothetical protein
MNQLASNACFSAETYELVSDVVDSLNADVDAKRRGVQGEEPAQEGRAGEVLMRHGVDDVKHRPVGNPKRKV